MASPVLKIPVPRTILVFGATGLIGKPITKELVENIQSFDRLAIFTSVGGTEEKKALLASWKAAGADIIEGDVTDNEQILKAYKGIDTVVCALGRGALAHQINLIRLADATPEISRFIPSEFGTDIEHSPASKIEKPHQQKIKVRAALAATKTLDYTYVVTGPFAAAEPGMYLSANTLHAEVGSFDVKGRRAVCIEDGRGKIALTTVSDVAKFVLKVLQHPERCSRRALKLKSFTTTPQKIVEEFERQTDTTWDISYTSLPQLRNLDAQALDSGNPVSAIYTLRRIWAEGGTLYNAWDNAELGMEGDETDTLEDAVRLAIQTQTAEV
ncbi:MAG: hypothetical protein M1818_002217 [Claussenomyces sp. TS43310]|nr:MAG: hypothetical protein M1818_002217 [Claussenomyces sp. TS43310]